MNRLTTPHGQLVLDRYPSPRDPTLQAWDAADEYLLHHVESLDADRDRTDSPHTMVVNDVWGALATALADQGPTSYGDSLVSQLATRRNLVHNGIDSGAVTLLPSTMTPPSGIDRLLVRVPKSLGLLEHQLHQLAPHLHPGTVVVGAGMVKDIHTSTLELFERVVGPTTTSLARKKARLIFCTPAPGRARPADDPWPRRYVLPDGLGPVSGLTVSQHAGVFSSERLDIGTRFLAEHLPRRDGADDVIDLGCGNGVLGLAAAVANPRAEVTFTDESFLAVAAAEATYRMHVDPVRRVSFRVGDGLTTMASGEPIQPGSVDLVLNNPPFHLQRSRSDETAWRMFSEARAALRTGGELWVVGNQSLGYHAKLKRLFGNYHTVASNRKFVVLRAVR